MEKSINWTSFPSYLAWKVDLWTIIYLAIEPQETYLIIYKVRLMIHKFAILSKIELKLNGI